MVNVAEHIFLDRFEFHQGIIWEKNCSLTADIWLKEMYMYDVIYLLTEWEG